MNKSQIEEMKKNYKEKQRVARMRESGHGNGHRMPLADSDESIAGT